MIDRRHFLQRSLAALPILPGLVRAADRDGGGGSGRALIILWMDGGMSHLDTFDGKPEASRAIRGDLGTVRTPIDGVFVSEHLARIGALLGEACLIRSITSPEGNHDRGSHFMLTGRKPSPVLAYPSTGALLAHLNEARHGVPPYVAIPDAHPFAKNGFLPAIDAPFEVEGDPARPGFAVPNLATRPGSDRALRLLDTVDRLDGAPRSESEAARDALVRQARRLSLNPENRELFSLQGEPPEVRDRYGRHTFGQSCLLARRLVEGGVGTVFVRDTGWDHHQGIARALTYGFPPKLAALDQAVPALFEDLRGRGLLDRVTVILASEFGRTPRLNPAGGRDHWSRASSVLMFGAGLGRGVVVGRTDARGEEPIEDPVSPRELFATLLHAVGSETSRILRTPDGRPVSLVEDGVAPVEAVLDRA